MTFNPVIESQRTATVESSQDADAEGSRNGVGVWAWEPTSVAFIYEQLCCGVGVWRYRGATAGKRTAGSPKTQYPLAS